MPRTHDLTAVTSKTGPMMTHEPRSELWFHL